MYVHAFNFKPEIRQLEPLCLTGALFICAGALLLYAAGLFVVCWPAKIKTNRVQKNKK